MKLEHFDTPEQARSAEEFAIRTEAPRYNKMHNELIGAFSDVVPGKTPEETKLNMCKKIIKYTLDNMGEHGMFSKHVTTLVRLDAKVSAKTAQRAAQELGVISIPQRNRKGAITSWKWYKPEIWND